MIRDRFRIHLGAPPGHLKRRGMNPSRRAAGPATLRLLLVLLLMLGVLNGCAAVLEYGAGFIDRLFGETEEKTPAELMIEGEEYLELGRYSAAAEAFQQIKDRYPYSRFSLRAELLMADAQFNRGEYNAAFDAYDEYERLHPRNEHIPYVIYKKGECHLNQVATIDRDQTHTQAAREEYERLVKRFPEDRYADLARKKLRKCLIFLSEYELYVGHFYFKQGKYRAALGRYRYIIEHYPDMGQYHEAMEYYTFSQKLLSMEEAERQAELEKFEKKQAEKAAGAGGGEKEGVRGRKKDDRSFATRSLGRPAAGAFF